MVKMGATTRSRMNRPIRPCAILIRVTALVPRNTSVANGRRSAS